MQYSRLIDSLIDECIAASLGGYDVTHVIAPKAGGGDLIREILVRTVCDPRFRDTIRVARAWQDDAHDLLEEFADGLMKTMDLGREDAFRRMDEFLSRYFFTMVQRISSNDTGRDGVFSGRGAIPGMNGGQEAGEDGTGTGGEDPSDGERKKSQMLSDTFRQIAEGSEEGPEQRDASEGKGTGQELSVEDERKVELRYLRAIPSSLRRLARLIGRSDTGEDSSSGRFLTAARSDIAGITVGDDLGNLLPTEVALLAEKRTRDEFYRRFAEKRLQVFASASSGGGRPVNREDGPVVICLDRSSSMEGRPSLIARALTMAVAIIAGRRRREVIVVKYGNGQMAELSVRSLRRQRRDLVRFLTYGCAGGNNEDSMFGWVFRELIPARKDFCSADILCVSDFGWASVGDEVMGLIRDNKAKGMLFYGLDVSGEGLRDFHPAEWMDGEGAWPGDIIDSMWIWDDGKGECREEKKEKGHGKI